MLTALERERLVNRSKNSRIRANNDVRAKRKLKAWFEDTAEVMLILKHLPRDLIREVSSENSVYELLAVTEDLMGKRDFAPLRGKLDEPETWKAGDRLVNDLDIWRAWNLLIYIRKLVGFYGYENDIDNPFSEYDSLKGLYLEHNDRLTEGERKGIERINEAIHEYLRPTIEEITARFKHEEEPRE